MRRRLRVVTAAVLLLGFSSPRVPEASAQEKLNPPLVGMHDVSDPAGMVTIQIPAHIEPGGIDPNPTLLATWKVWLYDDTSHHFTVWLSRKSAFSRAPLMGSMTGSYRAGELAEGSGARGTNEWWEVRNDHGQCRTFRMIEHGGEVFEAGVSCTEKSHPILIKHIDAILSSFKGAGKPTPPELPPGFKVFESAGREVWSNDKVKSEVDRALALHADAWDRMKTLLPTFAPSSPVRVIICRMSRPTTTSRS